MAPRARRKPNRNGASEVPDVYRGMLAEAGSSPMKNDEDGRSVKRRRVAGRIVTTGGPSDDHQTVKDEPADTDADIDDLFEDVPLVRQSIEQSEQEDSDGSGFDWEDVNLKTEADEGAVHDAVDETEADSRQDLDLVLGAKQAPQRPRKKVVPSIEKKLRLEVHKMNICCLLIHAHIRNHWCNDDAVQEALRTRLSNKTISYLNPAANVTQFQSSRSFMDGLQQASDTFRGSFRKSARGMAKPQWKDPDLPDKDVPDDIDLPMEKEDFFEAARTMTGSRDVGAHLFCGMLRAVGVDARLVCSLQPLQFRAAEKAPTPQRQYTMIIPDTEAVESMSDSDHQQRAGTPTPKGSAHKTQVQDGGTNNLSDGARIPNRTKRPKGPIRECKYPVYWVEAFNEAVQKWMPVDPLVTQSVAKSTKFEPPLGERDNTLSYVIAFEDDGTARDVTRRYAKAFNAKTRRDRAESTKGGERWWKRVMKLFRRREQLDRDQVEDSELAAKEAAEPMPKNVLDFKDHPYYALERHLRRNEIIHPRREVGKVGTSGKGHSTTNLEPIFRRRDVLLVQSADKWFRMGREIKVREQPLKHATPPARKRGKSLSPNEEMVDGTSAGTPLYALHQTSLYRAPPLEDGRVSKNAYGNLDVYVPSMIPPGGAHIAHRSAAQAAKTLGVDFADAVTGFKFAGRHGTAVTNGIVVAAEYVEGVCEIIRGLEDDRARAEREKIEREALGMWRRFLTGLRIRERIEGYDVEGEQKGQGDKDEEIERAVEEGEEGGGFMIEDEAEDLPMPTDLPGHLAERQKPLPTSLMATNDAKSEEIHIPVFYGPHIRTAVPDRAALDHNSVEQDQANLFGAEEHQLSPTASDDHDLALQAALLPPLPHTASPRLRPTSPLKQQSSYMTADAGQVATSQPQEIDVETQEAGGFVPTTDSITAATEGEDGAAPQHRGFRAGPEPRGTEKHKPSETEEGDDEDVPSKNDNCDEDDDAGSLLSHDPEDEDVEDEWLMNEEDVVRDDEAVLRGGRGED